MRLRTLLTSILMLPLLVCAGTTGADAPSLIPATARGRMSADLMDIEGFPFRNLVGNISYSDNDIHITDLSAEFCGGKVSGSAVIMMGFSPPKYAVDLDLFGVAATEFKSTLGFDSQYLAGTLSGKIKAEGDFEDPPRLVLNGTIRMEGAEGDPFPLVTCRMHYEKRTLNLLEIQGSCLGGGSITGEMTFSFRKGDRYLTGAVNGNRVDMETVSKLVGGSSSILKGKVTGDADIRVTWKGEEEQLLVTGNLTGSELVIYGIPVTISSPYSYTGNSLLLTAVTGVLAEGGVSGAFSLSDGTIALNMEGSKVRLEQVLKSLEVKDPVTGLASFTSSLQMKSDGTELVGDVFLEVKEGNLSTAPGVMSALTLLALPSFNPHEFTEGRARVRLAGKRILVDEAELVSKKVSLKSGNGYVDFDGKMQMLFDVYSEASILSSLLGKFGSALANVLDPFSKVFKVEITNTIQDPKSSLKAFPKRIDTSQAPDPEKPLEPGEGADEGDEKPKE